MLFRSRSNRENYPITLMPLLLSSLDLKVEAANCIDERRFEAKISNLFLDSDLRGGCILVKIRKGDYHENQYDSFR